MSGAPIRLFLTGCGGRMGSVIDRLASADPGFLVVGGADPNPAADKPYPVWSDAADSDVEYDVLIDYSHPRALPSLLRLASRSCKPSVICTTGLSDDQLSQLRAFSQTHAVFQSANMSLGINLLLDLVRRASATLGPEYNIEIVETHHNQKLDAPSGTALMIALAAKEARDGRVDTTDGSDSHFVYERHSRSAVRDDREIGIHSIRGGNVVGEHEVLFAGPDELVKISHSISSRDMFGRGALAAARFMKDKKTGWYSMADLMQSR